MADAAKPKTAVPAAAPAAAAAMKPFLVVCAAAVVVSAGAGFGVARFLVGQGPAPAAADTPPVVELPPEPAPAAAPAPDAFSYYDFEPIVVNLDEPRLTRYIRITLTLAIRAENREAALVVIEKNKPELKNWLTVFFASCTLEQVRGAANLNRLRREILDAFCQQLWPDQKPLINHILFKEFAIS